MFGGNCGIYLILYWLYIPMSGWLNHFKPPCLVVFTPHTAGPRATSGPTKAFPQDESALRSRVGLRSPHCGHGMAEGRNEKSNGSFVDSLLGFHRFFFQPEIVYLNVYRNLPSQDENIAYPVEITKMARWHINFCVINSKECVNGSKTGRPRISRALIMSGAEGPEGPEGQWLKHENDSISRQSDHNMYIYIYMCVYNQYVYIYMLFPYAKFVDSAS